MQRSEALNWLKENLSDENHIKHSLAVEAIMRGIAVRLGEDIEKYGLAGLLHDIDYDTTGDAPEKHSLIGAQMLEDKGFPAEIVYAVKVHNEMHGLERNNSGRPGEAGQTAGQCSSQIPEKTLQRKSICSGGQPGADGRLQ